VVADFQGFECRDGYIADRGSIAGSLTPDEHRPTHSTSCAQPAADMPAARPSFSTL
jgi:hypothetical protein